MKPATKCARCESEEVVRLEYSRTAYHHAPCEHEDCLQNQELREERFRDRDPNKPIPLCRECAEQHHEYWDAMWAEVEANR